MKKYFSFIIFIIVVMATIGACKRKPAELTFEEKIRVAVEDFLDNPDIDSVTILNVDTLTPLGYSKIMLEFLENMQQEYQFMHKEAVFSANDSLALVLEEDLEEINWAIEKHFFYVNDENADNQSLLLHIVNGFYWTDGEKVDIVFFVTPDLEIHILDPFNHDLVVD